MERDVYMQPQRGGVAFIDADVLEAIKAATPDIALRCDVLECLLAVQFAAGRGERITDIPGNVRAVLDQACPEWERTGTTGTSGTSWDEWYRRHTTALHGAEKRKSTQKEKRVFGQEGKRKTNRP